jgi:uncharacterized repeat protein (TIGR02543 family)
MTNFANWTQETIVRGVQETVLRYDANGGTKAPSSQAKQTGESLIISETEPVRYGYKFTGWSVEKNSDKVDYYPGDILEEDVDVLYAIWSKEEEEIDILEPQIEESPEPEIEMTPTLVPTQKPIQTYKPTSTPKATPTATPTSTPVAEKPKVKVTITIRIDDKTSIKKEVYYGETYGELPIPEREGYDFQGWYLDEEYKNRITEKTVVEDNGEHTIYPKWIAKKYEVSFELNGGVDASIRSINVTYDSEYGTLPSPTKEGHTFNGWYLDNETFGSRIDKTTIVKTASNHILYAKWIANEYEIIFDMEDGSAGHSIIVTYNSEYGELPVPTKEGYTFNGWYKEDTFINKVDSKTVVDTADNHKLYAEWIANEYEVSFELNGGVVGPRVLRRPYYSNIQFSIWNITIFNKRRLYI